MTGLYVADSATGATLFSHQAERPLNPASNTKLVSTAAAIALLGADYQYATRVVGAMPKQGVVAGGVYLRGNYDPTLDTADIAALAQAVAQAGITSIEGNVYIGNPATRDGIYGGGYSVRVAAGKVGKAPSLSLFPPLPGVVLVNRATTTGKRRSAISVRTEAGRDDHGAAILRVIVTGKVRKGRAVSHHVAPKHVGRFTAELLKWRLAGAGVAVAGHVEVREFDEFVAGLAAAGTLATDLAVHESAPLAAIIATVNKRSVNWLADRVIYTAAAIAGQAEPSRTLGIEAMYAWLADMPGVSRAAVNFDTGSGLSYETRISAAHIVATLRAAGGYSHLLAEGAAAAFRASLAVGGQDGTLRARFKHGLHGRVLGKTGTLNPVIALGGFLTPAKGAHSRRELVFAIVSNELRPRQHGVAKVAHEQMVKALADYLDGQIARDALEGPAPEAAAETAADAAEPAELSDEMPTGHSADAPAVTEEVIPEVEDEPTVPASAP
ncbi:MAG: D-alanyl-D-alanine carboxypeptidase [Myxococcales bacterium]|nr:D-alanyl-D-alanine carboxypeptidase [Myxococcales bacterium]